ncbi:unnamed protein product [Angiostrongylus costaricensis]|uniref:GDSL esterase/lipase n=1 Tax=Angiostrongylus costaricensis TaxID=334426 RepID=A0A0R3PHS0_ANGCS|nr:unnamed protein product [Angiostrongylus costaricensis]
MPAHRLLPPHMAARSSNRSVDLCWCVGQLCNDYPSVPMNSVSTRTLYGYFIGDVLEKTTISCATQKCIQPATKKK